MQIVYDRCAAVGILHEQPNSGTELDELGLAPKWPWTGEGPGQPNRAARIGECGSFLTGSHVGEKRSDPFACLSCRLHQLKNVSVFGGGDVRSRIERKQHECSGLGAPMPRANCLGDLSVADHHGMKKRTEVAFDDSSSACIRPDKVAQEPEDRVCAERPTP